MRTMALDLGSRTIGIAVSDATGLLARGVETVRRRTLELDLARLAELIELEEVDKLVLGYPKNMNGSIGPRAQISEEFAEILRARFPQLPVILWDERLSTVAAEKVLISADMRRNKRKQIIDKMAAIVILQNYLDSVHK